MSEKYSSEYSDLTSVISTSFEENERSLRTSPEVQRDLGRQALKIEEFTVLGEPEVGNKALERFMHNAIIGQDKAIHAIVEAMDRNKVRMSNDQRPLMTLAFLGPTGVGKSETAKALAEYLSGGRREVIKIDCSDYSHGHEVSRLNGSPPGYIGHDRTPLLSKQRVEQPGVVVLFDEIEKGSEPLYDLMLQILGDGKMQLNGKDGEDEDAKVVSFRDATIILTSNLGAEEMNNHLRGQTVGFGAGKTEPKPEVIEKSAIEAFKKRFKPEFTNRFDKLVVFNPLGHDELESILDIKFGDANEQYTNNHGMIITATRGVYEHLIDKALEERNFGARPLIRAFEQEILTSFGRYLSGNQLSQGSWVHVYHQSECPPEVKDRFPDTELIFTHRYDQNLWEARETEKQRLEEERLEEERMARIKKQRAEEKARIEKERTKKTQPEFSDGDSNTDSDSDSDEPDKEDKDE